MLLASLGALTLFSVDAEAAEGYEAAKVGALYLPLPIQGGSLITRLNGGAPTESGPYGSFYRDVKLPFTYHFYGEAYDRVHVSSGGVLSFVSHFIETAPASSPFHTSFPVATIAPWWDKLICGERPVLVQDPSSGDIKTQLLGTAPNRVFVIEWDRCRKDDGGTQSHVQLQVWLHEGKDEVELRYGSINAGAFQAYMGLKKEAGVYTLGPAYDGEPCLAERCVSAEFPSHSLVTYSWRPANPIIDSVRADASGRPELPFSVTTTVQNRGKGKADQVGIKYWVSAKEVRDSDAIFVGKGEGLHSVEGGGKIDIRDEFLLPAAIGEVDPDDPEGEARRDWYLHLEVESEEALTPDSRRLGKTTFRLPTPAPDVAVGAVSAPDRIRFAEPFVVSWEAKNIGEYPVVGVDYQLLISPTPDLSAAAIPLKTIRGEEALSLNAGETLEMQTTLRVEAAGLRSGTYYIGVQLAPNSVVEHLVTVDDGKGGTRILERIPETTRRNNVGSSAAFTLVDEEHLSIENKTLPDAVLGGRYSVRLSALGGDGEQSWSVEGEGSLPPGLQLVVEHPKEGGAPQDKSAFIRGIPSQRGSFPFQLAVASAGRKELKSYTLVVKPSGEAISALAASLPLAGYNRPYEFAFSAAGGSPPYRWSLHRGRLPAGLELQENGRLTGLPVEDGSFDFLLRVEEQGGAYAEREYRLSVSSPLSLQCVSRELPWLSLGEAMEPFTLKVAGGQGPYLWRGERTLFHSGAFAGEKEQLVEGLPPPGLHLSSDGTITGTPTAAGDFLWFVEVLGKEAGSERCALRVRVLAEGGLVVTTQRLPTAKEGERFHFALGALGGVGNLRWSLVGDSLLVRQRGESGTQPLELSENGEIEGVIQQEHLKEGPALYSFLVRVEDEEKRQALVSLALAVEGQVSAEQRTETGGCQAGGRGAAEAALILLLLAALLRAYRGSHRELDN